MKFVALLATSLLASALYATNAPVIHHDSRVNGRYMILLGDTVPSAAFKETVERLRVAHGFR